MGWYLDALIIFPADAISGALCLPMQRKQTRMNTAACHVYMQDTPKHCDHRIRVSLWYVNSFIPLCLSILRKHNTSHTGLMIKHEADPVEIAYPENRKQKLVFKTTTNYSEDRKGRKCGRQYENHTATMIKTAEFFYARVFLK